MDKKIVKVVEQGKKLEKDIKKQAKELKSKPEPKVIKYDDIISGIGVKKTLFFKKHLEIKSEEDRTVFHDLLDKEIENLPNINGTHMKKVITTFKILIESDYEVKKRPYKDKDERYNNFKIIYYACNQFSKYWAIRHATGDSKAYKNILAWKKDVELINNVWIHLNSRAEKESKLKFVELFKKSMKITVKRIK